MNESWGFPNKATPPGSTEYYAIRFSAAEKHDDLARIFAFRRVLRDILVTCSDASVALQKLNWWREEINRTFVNNPQHPLTIELAELIQRANLAQPLFVAMLDATVADIQNTPVKTVEQLIQRSTDDMGSMLVLLSSTQKTLSDNEKDLLLRLGSFVRHQEIIRHVGADIRQNNCFLPRELMATHNISLANLSQKPDETAHRALFLEMSNMAQSRFTQAIAELPRRPARYLLPALTLAHMSRYLLQELQADNFPVLEQHMSLTPLRKMWLAWRLSRRCR